MRKPLRIALGVLVAVALGVWVYDQSGSVRWNGPTELSVEFTVTDAETGQSIEGAVLDMTKDPARAGDLRFRATTGPTGVAQVVVPNYPSEGTKSRLGFFNTRTVRNPSWMVNSVTAPGYRSLDTFSILEEPYRREVTHTGPGKDHLVVPIALHKPAQ